MAVVQCRRLPAFDTHDEGVGKAAGQQLAQRQQVRRPAIDAVTQQEQASGGSWRLLNDDGAGHARDQPQMPIAPHAVQKSQPSLRITVVLPHSAQSDPCCSLAAPESRGAWRMPISRRG